ncbi:MAG: peptidylprolyl isomerase [Oscillospiraceae bacterium]|jgi:parvulin-like peptidyl-prolyl isomerase|nr:peptidylprolyl isomerase [Oscillospiraceae bacterium]
MKKGFALLLSFALLLTLAGCQSAAERAVIVVEKKHNVTNAEAQQAYAFLAPQLAYLYAYYYGQQIDLTTDDGISQAKTYTLNVLAEQKALEVKLEEFGAPLTEEEIAEATATGTAEYYSVIEQHAAQAGETAEDAEQHMADQGSTLDAFIFTARQQLTQKKLIPLITGGSVVSPEQVEARYNELIATQTATYVETPSQFGSDLLNGTTIYVRPAGYRYIKNLLIFLPEDIRTQVSEKQSELSSVLYTQQMMASMITGETTLTDEMQAEYDKQMAELDAEYARIEQEIADLAAQGREQIRAKADEVLALCQAEGADFDALMAEYNQDTATGELVTVGYPVSADSTNYVPTFTEGAMALTTIGEVSGLVESDYGYHILQYAGDIESGNVPFADVQAELTTAVQDEQDQNMLTTMVTLWLDQMNIKTYISRFTL